MVVDWLRARRIDLSPKEWSTTAEDLRQKLDANPRYRLTIDWTIEEEPQ